MNDSPIIVLEKRLKELQKISRGIVRKLTTHGSTAAPLVPGGEELEFICYKGETTERDNLKQQLTDIVNECIDIENEMNFRELENIRRNKKPGD
jgi:hypothetical protein